MKIREGTPDGINSVDGRRQEEPEGPLPDCYTNWPELNPRRCWSAEGSPWVDMREECRDVFLVHNGPDRPAPFSSSCAAESVTLGVCSWQDNNISLGDQNELIIHCVRTPVSINTLDYVAPDHEWLLPFRRSKQRIWRCTEATLIWIRINYGLQEENGN